MVADIIPSRLDKALAVGADAVIDSNTEDVRERLVDLHGEGESMFGGRADTDIYLDAAGVPAVLTPRSRRRSRVPPSAWWLSTTTRPRGPGDPDEPRDHRRRPMGYPDEFFAVTADLVANWRRYALIVSDTIPFTEIDTALAKAGNTWGGRQGGGHPRLIRPLSPTACRS